MSTERIDALKKELRAEGYVVLKEATYRREQERRRMAERLLTLAEQDAERSLEWGRECAARERRANRRAEEVVAFAIERGATYDDLKQFNGSLPAPEGQNQ